MTQEAAYFADFLIAAASDGKTMAKVISSQHQKAIPKKIHNSPAHFKTFIVAIASSQYGLARVRSMLKNSSMVTRKDVRDSLLWGFRSCADVLCDDGIEFLASKSISDVEVLLPEVFGCVTERSIGIGHGSERGGKCINIPDDAIQGTKLKGRLGRLVAIHWLFVEFLLGAELCFLNSSGWKKVDGETCFKTASGWRKLAGIIVSLWGGRPYSFADTEHILCKIWLAIVHSHFSRNLVVEKQQKSNHCYPLVVPGEWEVSITPIMETIRKQFFHTICLVDEETNAAKKPKFTPKYPYPLNLLFEHEIYKKKRILPKWWSEEVNRLNNRKEIQMVDADDQRCL